MSDTYTHEFPPESRAGRIHKALQLQADARRLARMGWRNAAAVVQGEADALADKLDREAQS